MSLPRLQQAQALAQVGLSGAEVSPRAGASPITPMHHWVQTLRQPPPAWPPQGRPRGSHRL